MSIEAAIVLLAALIVGVATLFAVLFQRLESRLEARIDRLEDKVDALPTILRQEFAAMRQETAAQTSAIANAITAARAMGSDN